MYVGKANVQERLGRKEISSTKFYMKKCVLEAVSMKNILE